MTDKGRCDQCEFYEGPPQSDEKGVEGSGNAFQPHGYYKPPSSAPSVHRNIGSCHVAPLPAEVRPDDWCEMFKEQSP